MPVYEELPAQIILLLDSMKGSLAAARFAKTLNAARLAIDDLEDRLATIYHLCVSAYDAAGDHDPAIPEMRTADSNDA